MEPYIHIWWAKTGKLDNAKYGGGRGWKEKSGRSPPTASRPRARPAPPLPRDAGGLYARLHPLVSLGCESSPGARAPLPPPLPSQPCHLSTGDKIPLLRLGCFWSHSGRLWNMSGRARVRARGMARSPSAAEVGRMQASPSVGRKLSSWHRLAHSYLCFLRGHRLPWQISLPLCYEVVAYLLFQLWVLPGFLTFLFFPCWGAYLSKILI